MDFGVEPVIINLGLVIVMYVLAVFAQRLCLSKGVKILNKPKADRLETQCKSNFIKVIYNDRN